MVYSEKINVIVYGIEESLSETKRELCIKHDLQHVALSLIDSSIKSHAVKDLYRLLKFKPGNKP